MAVRASLFLLLILRLDDNTMFYVDLFYEVSFRFRVVAGSANAFFFSFFKLIRP